MGRSQKRKCGTMKVVDLDAAWKRCFSKVHNLPSLDGSEPLTNQQMEQYDSDLKVMKERLNSTKCLLNNLDIVQWQRHTKMMHLCSHIPTILKRYIKAELATQAWAKFYTILNTFDLFARSDVEEVNTVHLCEAPGSFVTSLNHFFKSHYNEKMRWNWCATTLNPYYEGNDTCHMIEDDRFIIETLPNWDFGADFTGNIMNSENFSHMKEKYHNVSVTLVTADGSTDCSENPGEQENLVGLLLLWETVTALSILTAGGCFVLKMFTIFEKFSISLVYLLNSFFQSVSFIKPGPSKPGNSEVYVVCEDFSKDECFRSPLFEKFLDAAMNNKILDAVISNDVIQKTFLQAILEYASISSSTQINIIKENLQSFKDNSTSKEELKEIKDYIAKRFLKDFSVYPIGNFVSPIFVLKAKDGLFYNRTTSTSFKQGSYNDRLQTSEIKEESVNLQTVVDNKKDVQKVVDAEKNVAMEDLHTTACTVDQNCFTALNKFKFILGTKANDITASCFIPSALLKEYFKTKQKYVEILNQAGEIFHCDRMSYHYEMDEINQRFPAVGLFDRKNMLFISQSTDDATHLINYLKERHIFATHKTPDARIINENECQSNVCIDGKFDVVTCDVGNIDYVSKQMIMTVIREVMFQLQPSQILMIRVEGLIFSAFYHGLTYLISGLFTNMSFIELKCSKDLYYIVLFDCTATVEVINTLNAYFLQVDDALLALQTGKDILHIVDIYTLVQSNYCKYMTSRNEILSKGFVKMISELY